MTHQIHDSLLLVYPLSATQTENLIERAATVARLRRLRVIVYTPVLSTAPPHSDVSTNPTPTAIQEGLELARAHARGAVDALRARQVVASISIDNQQSVVRGAFERIAEEEPAMMMIGGADYSASAEFSLTEGGLLERCPIPIWVVNTDRPDAAVLGALELDSSDPQSARLDEQIATEANRTATALDATSHVVHSLTTQAEMPRLVESMAPGATIDRIQQDREDAHVARAHALAERHGIAPENVHMERGEFARAVVGTAEAVQASVVVLGAAPRGTMSRLLFESTPQRLLERLRADMLIVNQPPM
jgi:nucleotide-binding universal stress UspA family protein